MSQFVIRHSGQTRPSGPLGWKLPNMKMTFIKSNNHYYNPHTARGRVGASCQAGNLGAVRRRV